MNSQQTTGTFSRRQFIIASAAGIAGAATARLSTAYGAKADTSEDGTVTFGLVTDVHHADYPPGNGDRNYRDSRAKLQEAVEMFNRRKVDFVVELGDFCDCAPTKEEEIEHLQTIGRIFEGYKGPRHYVLGNHCVRMLTKEEFLENCGAKIKKSHYSFDSGPYHFVVLDANFLKDETPYAGIEGKKHSWTDTWIPTAERKWLADDLKKAGDRKAIIFVHQLLDDEKDAHGVKNAADVRKIIESAGNVLAVFQGHKHPGGYAEINGIPYCTLRAMVEGPGLVNNSYAIVTIKSDKIKFEAFGKQYPWVVK